MAEALQALIAALTFPGLPGWTGLILALLLGLLVLAFLGMPFAVYGVKSRLEALEVQLADLRAELRRAGPSAAPRAPVEQDWEEPTGLTPRREAQFGPRLNPPVPPPPAYSPPPLRERRAEPKLDWRPPRT
ncbi:MAG: hypothetical protein INF79_05780 [Roseomonas sp.]|nr:hypothetical protein [Roseomonas sp.]